METNPQTVMVYGNMLAVDQIGQTINQLRYRQLTLEDLLCFQIIGQPAVFMRHVAFEKAGGLDIDFHFMLDHQLWIKLAAQGPIVHVNETWSAAPIIRWRRIPSSSRICTQSLPRLDSAETQPDLAPILHRVQRRARASVERVIRVICLMMVSLGMRSRRGSAH